MATIGVKVELEGQKEYQQGMKNLKEQTKLFDTQLKNLDQTMKGSSAFSKAIKEHELLKGKMEALSKESELLQSRIQEATDKFGENDTRTISLKNQYERLQGEIARTNEALQKNSGVFSAIGAELDELGNKLSNTGDKIAGVGENLTKNLTGPIAALGAASVAAFNEVDEGLDIIVKKTGASGEALEEMKGIAEDIATTIPTSFDKVGEAVGEVNTRFGSTGDELQTLSTQFIKFSELNNTDVSNSIDTVQKALSAYGLGAESAAGYLDRLNLVGQQTGVSVDSISQGIISNATAFQELGLSIDEAVTFMGQLEKSGANSETVLNGMRKALKNAAAEGKPLDQALSELQDTIENGAEGMDGLTAAYDLFGKSGDQIYGAVKNGTINFKKLAGTLEDAGGSITETFEATQDPIDQFKTNLNKLKIAGTNLVQAANPMISQFFDNLSKAIDAITAKWNSLSAGEQEQIIKIGLIVAAVGPLLVAIGKVVSAIGSIMSVTSALIGFIIANPVLAGIVVTLGLVTAAIVLCRDETESLSKKYDTVIEQQKNATDAAKSYNDEMDRFVQNNQSVVAGIDMQFQSEQKLLDELKSIVDENGRVKEGYEERARVIAGELSQAFGIDIQYQNDTIQNYDEIMAKIDQVIAKKKAEALLSAGQQEYTKALQEQKEKYESLKVAEENLEAAESDLAAAKERAAAAQEAMNTATDSIDYEYAFQAYEQAQADIEGLSADVEALTNQYTAQADAFYQNQAVIQNYDALQQALAEGTENLDGVLSNFTNNLVTNAPIDYLKQQAEDAKTYYDQLVADAATGEVAISEAQLAAAKSNAEQAQFILAAAVESYRAQGQAAGEGYAQGISGMSERIKGAAASVAAQAVAAVAAAQQTGSPAKEFVEQGEYAGEGYALGLENQKALIQSSLASIDELLKQANINNLATLNEGLLSNQLAIQEGLQTIISDLDLNFADIETKHETFTKDIEDQTNTSIDSVSETVSTKMGEISENISTNCGTIEESIAYLIDNSQQWGSDFIGNFEKGIISKMNSLLETVKRMAEEIASYMHFSVPDKGPLADADKWMPDFMNLLAQGIDTNSYLVENAVKGLSMDMADMMSNPIDPDDVYDSIRRGASDATTRLVLNGRELTRGLKDLGVSFNG